MLKFIIAHIGLTLSLFGAALLSSAESAQADYPKLKKGVVKIIVEEADSVRSTGAGIVVGVDQSAAFVLTAYHVIEKAQKIQVVFYHKQYLKFAGIGFEKYDEDLDIAVVMVDLEQRREISDDLPEFNRSDISQINKRDKISAIGHPLNLEWYASDNTIAKLSDQQDSRKFRFTKTAIERGNSGGPVLKGNALIGMVLQYDSLHARAVYIDTALELLQEWRIPTNRVKNLEPPYITVTGSARLKGSTRARAEENAIINAFQAAIIRELDALGQGDYCNSAIDAIIARSEKYILSHEKLRQWDDGETLNVKLKAAIAQSQVENDFRSQLAEIEAQVGNPVITFALTAWEVSESKGAKKKLEGQILIDAFQEQFKNRGFDLKAVDEARRYANTGIGKIAAAVSAGRKAIAVYARKANANFVARGEITATYKGIDPATGTHKWAGTISCEIINAATAELSSSYSKTVIKFFPDKSQGLSALMHSAAKNAARTMAKQTLCSWQQDAAVGRVYHIVVENVPTRRDHRRKLLHVLRQFCEIRSENYNSQKKKMVIDVIFKGSANSLEDIILDSESIQKFQNFNLSRKSGNHLVFTF